jgi:quercetin dioxygenase-like cupin family protein
MNMSEEGRKQALRPSAGGMLSLNVMDEIARLKARPEWLSGNRLAASLVKDDALNIALIVLKKGARLAEHRTKGPVAVHVLSGSVRLSAAHQHTELSPGGIAALDRNIAHSLEALEESVVLLTTAIVG